MRNNYLLQYIKHVILLLFFIGCNNKTPSKVKTCLSQVNNNKGFYKKFGIGPPLKYIKTNKLNHERYDSNLDSLLEYIHTYNSDEFVKVEYEWYSNRKLINNINFSVLTYKDGLYYHEDTLYHGSVFYSNYDVKEKYCCDNCTPLENLIKRDFIVENGNKLQ
jgi:hypothetical protein